MPVPRHRDGHRAQRGPSSWRELRTSCHKHTKQAKERRRGRLILYSLEERRLNGEHDNAINTFREIPSKEEGGLFK